MKTQVESASHQGFQDPHPLVQHHAYRLGLVTAAVDKAQQERHGQSKPAPHLAVEEAGRPQHRHVAADEFPPDHGLLALRSREDAMTLEDIPHRLVTNRVAQVLQGALNAIIAPRAVFAGHAQHQRFNFLIHTGTANRLRRFRNRHGLAGELTVPGENRVRLGHGGNLGQGFLAQLGADFSEFFAFTVGELHPTVDLVTQNAILCCQIIIV